MSDPQRLEFVTRHFSDLQTIRFAPVPIAMILAVVAHRMPAGRIASWSILLSFLLAVIGFYWWSTVAIRRRYGSVQALRDESLRMERHPMITFLRIAIGLAAVWCFFFPITFWSEIYCAFTLLLFMLTEILDPTNLAIRRIVWGRGLAALFGAVPFLVGIDGGAPVFALGGGTWLTLSVFDFMLLRRTLDHRMVHRG